MDNSAGLKPPKNWSRTDEQPRRKRIQKAFTKDFQLPSGKVLPHGDFTVFIERSNFIQAVKSILDGEDIADSENECPETIDLAGPVYIQKPELKKSRRLHAALCFGAKYYSVTIRKKLESEGGWDYSSRVPESASWPEIQASLSLTSLEKDNWDVSGNAAFVTSQCAVADILFPAIFPKEESIPAAGLVLIAGGTGSGKTTILNGLLAKYLIRLLNMPLTRRPHVITAGDPVETVFYQHPEKGLDDSGAKQSSLESATYRTNLVDFTARILATDVASVDSALDDALRETPSAYIVSELRKEEDFKATLKFAATGQLIFATAHNTSLVDALRKLMMYSSATDSPSARSLLAQRLKAVVHLRNVPLAGNASITLPTVWLGNSAGIRNFVCDGLASLLPHGPRQPDSKDPDTVDPAYREGTVGLSWAVHELEKRPGGLKDGYRDIVRTEASRLDLAIR
jgi:hypothetical protein